jgi:hypothetical protein
MYGDESRNICILLRSFSDRYVSCNQKTISNGPLSAGITAPSFRNKAEQSNSMNINIKTEKQDETGKKVMKI